MSMEVDRLKIRFDDLFANEGLTNIKFFIKPDQGMTKSDFISDLNAIQDTISAGDFELFEDVDGDAKTRRFDDSF